MIDPEGLCTVVSARAERAGFPDGEAEGRAVRLFDRIFCAERFAFGESET
ncbi:hypothetical protein HSR121_1410 [Halapricum desulfuricans]|uniref:Uncharacterized protein n=1 Tax=Halapricum desulfuricans TaxID=2841257 RepID=A0A897N367_9EURY|nr:hypothetical protein HSR121_1410 [Halapricum desulfuricans]